MQSMWYSLSSKRPQDGPAEIVPTQRSELCAGAEVPADAGMTDASGLLFLRISRMTKSCPIIINTF